MTLAERVSDYLKALPPVAPAPVAAQPSGVKSASTLTPADLAELVLGGNAADSGANVNPTTAMRWSTVYACVKVLAESVGVLPLMLYRQLPRGREYLPTHYLQKLLRKPNDYQTGQEFWEMCVIALKLRGNFYAYVSRETTGRIQELLPYQPGACVPRLREDGEVTFLVTFPDGTQDVLPASRVLHIKGPSMDGLVGMSDIEQARNAIGLGMSTEKHGAVLFKNGGRPQGVLSTDQVIKDVTYDRIKKEWAERHEGVENSHRTAILEAGLKYQPMTMNNSEAQFLETRKFQRAEICGIFRVPPHMIGDLERATFTNIEHQGQEFVTYSLLSILTRIESRVSEFLLGDAETHSDLFVKFDVREMMRGDMKARGQYFTQKVQAGAMSPNEWREEDGYNPRAGGDIYLTPTNMLINGKAPDNGKNEETSPPA